jgi:hypothetical protein
VAGGGELGLPDHPEGEGIGPDETLIRLVTSFATIEEETCQLVDIARAAPSRQAAE